jgi:hypothetical protein
LGLLLNPFSACGFSNGPVRPAVFPDQVAQYEAAGPKTLLELQQFRRAASQGLVDRLGRHGTATLVELNPDINSWFLLRLDWDNPVETHVYHLENPEPLAVHLALANDGHGLRINTGGQDSNCPLWIDHAAIPLEDARRRQLPYVPVCAGRLYLRNPVAGTYTHLEEVTNFLRDHIWGGERIVSFVKEEFFQDEFAEQSLAARAAVAEAATGLSLEPSAAQLDSTSMGTAIIPEHLALDVRHAQRSLVIGAWYPINNAPGIYVSAIRPGAVAASILSGFRGRVSNLDPVEANADDYLVAFDLNDFELGFTLGTDHPRLDWSGRELPEMHDEHLTGPDGVGTSAPLARSGMVSPALTARTAATFAGGFKREHSAFRYGPLAVQNHGSHYGFLEQGTVFSKLQPGLATVYVLADGSVGMKTWTKQDNALLPKLRHARQNGVPLIEQSVGSEPGTPGPLVSFWGAGNWSGSADKEFRTLRAGLCVQSTGTRRFLIYGYFSTATPSAMVRVFQAYSCQYAMHLDMNALEHTYLALYTHQGDRLLVQHLIEGMGEVDRKGGRDLLPRFLGFPDDRDFFYVVRRLTQAAPGQAVR